MGRVGPRNVLVSTAAKPFESISGLALAWTVLTLLATPAAAQLGSFELVPGVVVDQGRETLYLMTPEGAVEKLSVTSGNSLWTSPHAAKPLGLFQGHVISQVDGVDSMTGLEIALLNAADGSVVGQRLKTTLPSGVRSSIDDRLGLTFEARARVLNEVPYVTWVETRRYSKGVAPPPGTLLVQEQTAAYRMDTQARRLLAVDPALLNSSPQPPAGVLTTATGGFAEPPAAAGEVIAATEVLGAMVSPAPRIVLKRWHRSSGVALPDQELFRGSHILQYRSSDGLHLLVSERVAPRDFDEYEWSVFSLETGRLVGRLRSHRSHASFFVTGPIIVFEEPPYSRSVAGELVEQPRRLRAAILGSGSEVWERSLRDTAYRGLFPP